MYFLQVLYSSSLVDINVVPFGAWLAALLAVFMLLLSAFASGSEIAFFSLSPNDVNALDPDRSAKDKSIEMLRDDNERTLATILIANNFVNVMIIMLLNYFFSRLITFKAAWLEMLCITVLLTFLLLLFGEIMPKVFSRQAPLRYCRFAVNGILFNHESERRGENFVTRKITLAAARIAQGMQDKLYLGNLNALRDWGYAKDYVECMWLILQHDKPEDFVIATGEMHTVREFCTLAFREAGIELEWEGEGVEERGRDKKTGHILVEVDPKYFRPSEVEQLLGDPTKARTLLGWNPTSTPFEELVRIMVRHDMEYVKNPVNS